MLKHMDATAITINTLVIPGYRATIDANIYTLAVCYYNPNSSQLTNIVINNLSNIERSKGLKTIL